jgi:predicted Zn-ribbon and HTH transcriptional regulator
VRRIPRILLNALTALSLLLCVATCVLWACSYWLYNDGFVRVGQQYFALNSGNGRMVLYWYTGYPETRRSAWNARPVTPNEQPTGWADGRPRSFAIHWHRELNARKVMQTSRDVVFPHAALAALAALLPLARAIHHRRSLRGQRAGLCPACGYDLRATPGRCPECGSPANTLAASSPSSR